ncbi:MAG: TraR/DksA family transcriptional regulator [Nitrospira sp.]|nr:TraR/DksA family transcriptional regulator [Nitrospira sp.]
MAGKSTKKTSTAVAKRAAKTSKTKATGTSQSQTRKVTSKASSHSAKRTAGEAKTVKKQAPAKAKAPKRLPSSRSMTLRKIMLEKRVKLMKEIQDQLGQSLTEEQQRRFESAMDSGDQALLDLEREMGISLQEKRNRERQMIDEALVSLEEGTYGICVECNTEISEKRLAVMPFARLCVECQEKIELLEKIERGEQRI